MVGIFYFTTFLLDVKSTSKSHQIYCFARFILDQESFAKWSESLILPLFEMTLKVLQKVIKFTASQYLFWNKKILGSGWNLLFYRFLRWCWQCFIKSLNFLLRKIYFGPKKFCEVVGIFYFAIFWDYVKSTSKSHDIYCFERFYLDQKSFAKCSESFVLALFQMMLKML